MLGEGSLNARFADLEDAGNLRQRMPIGAEFLGGLAALGGHHSGAAADAALGPCVFQAPHGVFADRVNAELCKDGHDPDDRLPHRRGGIDVQGRFGEAA